MPALMNRDELRSAMMAMVAQDRDVILDPHLRQLRCSQRGDRDSAGVVRVVRRGDRQCPSRPHGRLRP